MVEWKKLHSIVRSISTGLNPRSNFILNEDGASLHYYDEEFNLPVVLRDRVVQLLKSDPPQSLSERYSVGRTVMNNAKLNDRLNDIFQKEHSSNEIHWETLQLLAVIIHTLHSLLEGRYGLRGLLDIGCLLRNDGERIDYVRLKSSTIIFIRAVRSVSRRKKFPLQARFTHPTHPPFIKWLCTHPHRREPFCFCRPVRYTLRFMDAKRPTAK